MGQKGPTDAFCVYEIDKKDLWFRDSLGVKAVKGMQCFKQGMRKVYHLYVSRRYTKGGTSYSVKNGIFKQLIDHTFYGFTGVITHAGCWENKRKTCKSQAEGE